MALVTVIPGTFTTPGLPTLGILGFRDTFTRPEANTLGSTEGMPVRPWTRFSTSSGTSTWGTTGNGTAKALTTGAGGHYAVVDAGTMDGTLTVVLGPTVVGRAGIALRSVSGAEYMNLEWTAPSSPLPKLFERANGVSTTIGQSSISVAPGMVFAITLAGDTITVTQDGVTTITATSVGAAEGTLFGMFSFAADGTEWASLEFTPA